MAHLCSRSKSRRPQEHCTCALWCRISRIVPCFRDVATYLMHHGLVDSASRQPSGRLRAVSLFSWSIEQNARDTQLTTRVTEGARQESQLAREEATRGFVARRSRARVLPSLNLKKKRDCSQSNLAETSCGMYV